MLEISKIKPRQVIHCNNDEEKLELLQMLEQNGYVWVTGEKPTDFIPKDNVYIGDNNTLWQIGDVGTMIDFKDLKEN